MHIDPYRMGSLLLPPSQEATMRIPTYSTEEIKAEYDGFMVCTSGQEMESDPW